MFVNNKKLEMPWHKQNESSIGTYRLMITFTVIRNDKFIYHNVWSIIVKVNSKHIILYVIKKSTVVYMGIICNFASWGMGGNNTGYNCKAIGMPKFHQDIAA